MIIYAKTIREIMRESVRAAFENFIENSVPR